ncbi:hypothetical protein [Labrenzia sp. 011]|uniref:hypothetical protein n=1 Tax=Labrenzia sp. 011 TaxID=2171494 RepID=UPI000D508483|nr:hypothetical protein [Labrenzia sp. 011]PVB62709.1 hypothetical protein DCO57_05525 [Labrenzia sp. 011]
MSAVDMTAAVGGSPQPQMGALEAHAAMGRAASPAEKSGGSFNFGDFLDVINPLQHIPGIAELYRSVTNDQISDDARKAGNAFYGFALGGPVGLGAMLAYSAAGDRWSGSPQDVQPADVQVADASAVAGAAETSETSEIPVPVPKPDRMPETAPVESRRSQGEGQGLVLGQTVASTADKPGMPLSLSALLSEADPVDSARETGDTTETGASSVAYVDGVAGAKPQQKETGLPDEQGLGRLAAHQANHLPLDVLKALQERHAQRTSSERS